MLRLQAQPPSAQAIWSHTLKSCRPSARWHSKAVAYAVDQLQNPDSIVLTHGGPYAPEVIIAGRVGTASATRVAKALQSSFSNAIAKLFTRINAYYVGPGAARSFELGCRLTHSVSSPAEYNLALRT